MDKDALQLNLLKDDILESYSSAEVDVNACCKNASWEADIILVAVQPESQLEIAEKFKDVATQKIVLFINPLPHLRNGLQQLLPFTKLGYIFIDITHSQNINLTNSISAIIEGDNAAALHTATKIIQTAGFITTKD